MFMKATIAIVSTRFTADHDLWQTWHDILASTIHGIVVAPLTIFFVWILHWARLDRWNFISAIGAVIMTVGVLLIFNETYQQVSEFGDKVVQAVGLQPFRILIWPALSIQVICGTIFAVALKRRSVLAK